MKITNSPTYTIQKDGDSWVATDQDFVNLQESKAGYGDNPMEAVLKLVIALKEPKDACETERVVGQFHAKALVEHVRTMGAAGSILRVPDSEDDRLSHEVKVSIDFE